MVKTPREITNQLVTEYIEMHATGRHFDLNRLAENIERALIEYGNQKLEEAAHLAFEKIRCDDRTDRLQVAKEVAAHIRVLKSWKDEI